MSRKGKLSAAALLVLVGAVGVATSANAFQPRKHCEPNNWRRCATDRPLVPEVKYPSYLSNSINQVDARAEAMQNAGGGGGGGK